MSISESMKAKNILIAPDKFKGSLSAFQVIDAIAKGILTSYPNVNLVTQPMADGGDGSIDLLHELWQLEAASSSR